MRTATGSGAAASRWAAVIAVLFTLGVIFGLLFSLLQAQHHVTLHADGGPAALILGCGLAAVLIGWLYPYADRLLGRPFQTKAIDTVRCVGFFLGVNYATTKMPFDDHVQLALALAVIAVALWYLFDGTGHGFVISLAAGVLGTVAVQLLVSAGAYSFTRADFFGVRSWIPCVLFSAGVCLGNIGRGLAAWVPPLKPAQYRQ